MNTEHQIITELFFHYGISVNVGAYNVYNEKSMKELKSIVLQDAERFIISVYGRSFDYAKDSKIDGLKLTEHFFNKALKHGLRNANTKGWTQEYKNKILNNENITENY